MAKQQSKKKQSKSTFIPSMVAAAIGLILGLVIAIFSEAIINVLFVILGVVIIIASIPNVVDALSDSHKQGLIPVILSAIPAIIGLVLIFWHNSVVMVIVGIYMLIFPIVRILMSYDPKAQFSLELRNLILGLVLILVGPGKIISWAGWGLVILSVGYAVYALIKETRF
ncbi:MAG: hypothetical protein IKA82_03155 [Clostridia bacterium]|nr:hypothetical protein [Clostridia bacterium]